MLFRWLTRLLTKSKSKDTEARRLKAKLEVVVEERKRESALGDEEATLKLQALDQTITEQSLRLVKKIGPKALAFPAFVVLALAVGGCVTKSSHTEGDREVNDQQKKAGAVIVEATDAAVSAIDSGDLAKAKTLLGMGALAGSEVVKNAEQQEKVHGAPARSDLPAFSPEASEAARNKSTEDHKSGNWVNVALTIGASALSVAATLFGMPWLAPIFPKLAGKLGTMAKTGVEILNNVRAKAQENGGSIDLKTMLEIAKDKNISAGVQSLVSKHAHAHEEAAGLNLTSMIDLDGNGIDDRLEAPPEERARAAVAATPPATTP